MNRKLWTATAAAILVTSFAAVSSAAAASDGSTTPSGGDHAKVCEHQDAIFSRIDQRIAGLQQRIERLTTLRDKADEAGRTNVVERIDNAIARANQRVEKLTARKAELTTWVTEHCESSAG